MTDTDGAPVGDGHNEDDPAGNDQDAVSGQRHIEDEHGSRTPDDRSREHEYVHHLTPGGHRSGGTPDSHEEAPMSPDTMALRERLRIALGEFVELDIDDDGDLFTEHEGVRVFVGAIRDELEQNTVTVFGIPYAGLTAKPALFRWVSVTANRFKFGALSAYVREDNMVNLNFSHAFVVEGLTDEALRSTILPVVYTCGDLRQEARSLFA